MYTLTLLLACALLAVRVPATPVAEDNEGGVPVSDQNDIVNKHNELRRGVDPPASNMLKMSWNDEAAANAQKWASGCSMDHSKDHQRTISTSGCGENIFMADSKLPWESAVQSWHSEVKNFLYGEGSLNNEVVGHFTQEVWYSSNQVGCGLAYCPNAKAKYFYVCQYCPAGNYQFRRPYKSGQSCGDCPNACDDGLCTNPCPFHDSFSNCPDLTKQWGCGNPIVAGWCPASCHCTNKII